MAYNHQNITHDNCIDFHSQWWFEIYMLITDDSCSRMNNVQYQQLTKSESFLCKGPNTMASLTYCRLNVFVQCNVNIQMKYRKIY